MKALSGRRLIFQKMHISMYFAKGHKGSELGSDRVAYHTGMMDVKQIIKNKIEGQDRGKLLVAGRIRFRVMQGDLVLTFP